MSRRVLVVDDEPDIRAITRAALQHVAGWEVLMASSGAEALEVAAVEQPDAILLDAMMPGMDGAETARRLAADDRTARIPVLLLTAKVFTSGKPARDELPVVAILAKPFDPRTLAAEIDAALGWPT
jgi:CheY-like chemotaxis protein